MRYDAHGAALALTVMLAAVPARSQPAALDAAKCRAGAQAIARSIGGVVGDQTHTLVSILYAPEPDIIAISYLCGPMSPTPGLSVTWTSGDPTLDTLNVITEASATFAGAASAAVTKKLTACMSEARKNKKTNTAGVAEVALDVRTTMQCQIFSRLGGTVYLYPEQK